MAAGSAGVGGLLKQLQERGELEGGSAEGGGGADPQQRQQEPVFTFAGADTAPDATVGMDVVAGGPRWAGELAGVDRMAGLSKLLHAVSGSSSHPHQQRRPLPCLPPRSAGGKHPLEGGAPPPAAKHGRPEDVGGMEVVPPQARCLGLS